jgi:hypothetical protein
VLVELSRLRGRQFAVASRVRELGFDRVADQIADQALQTDKLLKDFIQGRLGIAQLPGQTSLLEDCEDLPF